MIEKILTVSNIGKFRGHMAAGDQAFRKLTVIYGDNAIGKTTLAAILDSLRENSPGMVMGRKTLGSSGAPEISVLTSAGVRSFRDGAWDAPHPVLEVFNSDFVSRVVYSGDHVSNEHQKGLCSLLIGRTAVAEGKRLDDLRAELKEINTRLREVEGAIKGHIHGTLDVADFVGLPEKEGVDSLLEVAKRKADAAQNLASVLEKVVPARTDLPAPDAAVLSEVLGRSIDCISADAVARIAAHSSARMDGAGGPWLREGMRYVNGQRCPFCDQTLDSSDLYPALQQYFSDAYETYERSLYGDLDSLLEAFDPSAMERATERLLRQRAVATAWDGQVMGIEATALSTDLSTCIATAVEACKAMCAAVSIKKRDPLKSYDLSALEPQLEGLQGALATLQAADVQVGTAMTKIHSFVETVRNADVNGLKRNVEQLENERVRHDDSVAPLCNEYLRLVVKKEEVTGAGKAAKVKMDQSMESLLAKYRDEMNAYLEHFGSAIRIENPRTNHKTKPPSVEYSISIDGVSFPLGKPMALKDVPCFGNTLSDGEKNLFALSLFLAHVKTRADLDQVVVVIDDPVNSLDQERRLMIAQTLLNMRDKLAQVVVLTHEPRLAHMLYRSGPAADCKMLCIRRDGDSSCIRDWDTKDRDLASDYFRNYFTIADYVGGKPVDWQLVSRSIRPFAEDYLRQRFPGEFGDNEWLGQMADRIDEAGSQDQLASMKPKLVDIRLIAKATNPTHHGSTHATAAEKLNATSTEMYAKKALGLVC